MSQVEGIYYPATMSTPQSNGIAHAPAAATARKQDLPDSQESAISTVSSTFSAPKLPSSSSNLSTSTTTDTDLTTPTSANVAATPSKPAEAPMPNSPGQARGPDAPAIAPRIDTAAANAPQTGDTAASPMALTSPATQGFKRTADGSLKGDETATPAEAPRAFAHAHKRNKSMDTHRIGELSAQLKTRLSYAMVKVQNGWEKQSLDELEEVHSQRGSPNSAPGKSDRLAFDSPSAFERQRRPSGVSDGSDHMLMSPASDPSGAHAASSSLYWRPGTKHALDAAANLMSVTGAPHGLGLAPAPEIQPGRRRRSSASHPPPPLIGNGQRKHFSDLGSSQRAPATPRAGILRMPSQQAERDAVDTLLFMGSPNASQRYPHNTQTAPSPLRADAPQRRVMFDAYPPQERRIVYQPQMPPPQQHQYGPYAAHPAR
ncbi:hypothetical protein HBI26_126390 [Parastagonospora nodorum]|nr:hypothetical protein HBH82_155450 [Parastagonospora nodorum]KAH4678752.1 hypothetical protein HBH78_142310 [Parastagonospora nodorum]KAH4708989.1 hypothetical protein HBH67_053310 [Parastagonospora nodorum]KAH4773343.1 hypothetical protein HBH63_146580 [Parastagonospora nodorum]KAH4774443.1 hypothetical protein HBH62_181920 [Parastagonospora nodorum]